MKKIVMSLLAVTVMATVVNAQTNKGDWMVGGNMTINTTKDNSQFAFQPSAGYFLINNLAVGAQVTLDFGKLGDTKTSEVGVGPFARYYFNLKEPNFKPFLHVNGNFANLVTKYQDIKTKNTANSFFAGAGGAFFINPNVALEAVAGYNMSKVQGQSEENGFLFRIGFQVHLLGSEVGNKK